jgi:GGDEF domain-containing protein
MTSILERRNQLTQLDKRNWHLWALALAISILLALCIAAVFYPAIRWGVDRIETRYGILPQLIFGLLALVLLSAVYVIIKQRELNEMRSFIVSGLFGVSEEEGAFAQDALTGVLDRRALGDILRLETKRADRYRSTLCLVLFDIWGFGKINEKQGNLAGDLVLKDLGQALQSTVRHTDIILRYGADEFLCLLPGTEGKGGEIFVQRVVKSCAQVNRPRGLLLDSGLAVYRMGGDPDTVLAEAERDLVARKGTTTQEVDVLLECTQCNSRQTVQLTLGQYRELVTESSVTRRCQKCNGETRWGLGFVDVPQGEQPPPA